MSVGVMKEAAMMFASHVRRVEKLYRVTDRLRRRTVQVHGRDIAAVVSVWLAELDAHSPLVDDLARAARSGDWASAYAIGDQLSIDVTVAVAA